MNVLFFLVFISASAFAQDGVPTLTVDLSWIEKLAQGYPLLTGFVTVVGILRLVLKPVFSILRNVADATKSTKDNQILDKVEKSKITKAIFYVLDYLGSIKLK